MRPFAQTALVKRLSLEAGVMNVEEAVSWAEGILSDHSYDDDVANVALYSGTSLKEIAGLIGRCTDPGADELDAMRMVLGKLAGKLREEPQLLEVISEHLESFWTRQDYELPDDMYFMIGLHDSVLLAKDGIYGSLEAVRKSLQYELERFI